MGLGFPEAAEGVNERTGQSEKKKKGLGGHRAEEGKEQGASVTAER